MSELRQFLEMRKEHDVHSRGAEFRAFRSCEACIAIEAWDALMRAVEGLTPGGSEFYRDPERCLNHVAGRTAEMHELIRLQQGRIAALEEQLQNCRQGKTQLKRRARGIR